MRIRRLSLSRPWPFTPGALKPLLSLPPPSPADTLPLRILDAVSWNLSHPAGRERVHAWRRSRRAESLASWRRRRLVALLRGEAPGPPPWLRDGESDGNP